ncbi:MAG: hypothetical protein ACI9T8_000589 [Candidatus Saccharimonadales bacterium]
MAAAVEFAPPLHRESNEAYGHGVGELSVLGSIALSGVSLELNPVVEHNFDNFTTGTTENIATDQEFGENLIVETPNSREIIGGKVYSKNGRSMVEVVSVGAEHSAALAAEDPSYAPQQLRDEGDVLFAKIGDQLEVGEVLHGVSMDPKEQFAIDPKKWESIGYRKGMAVQHIYYKLNETTMLTWTNIIKQSDKAAIAKIYTEEFGTHIDPNTHSDVWIRNLHRSKASQKDVMQIGRKTMDRHKELTGSNIDHYSTTEFITGNMSLLQEYFDGFMIPLSRAVYTGKNEAVLQELAKGVLDSAKGLSAEVMSGLLRVGNKISFDHEDARLMQSMIRYAVVEDLRQKLPAFMHRNQAIEGRQVDSGAVNTHVVSNAYIFNPRALNELARDMERTQMMSLNISRGVEARRSSGGCSQIEFTDELSAINLTSGLANNMLNRSDTQQDHGVVNGKDGKGPLKFKCTQGHENTREDGKKLESICKTCKEDVSCGSDEEDNEDASAKVVSLFDFKKSKQPAKAT